MPMYRLKGTIKAAVDIDAEVTTTARSKAEAREGVLKADILKKVTSIERLPTKAPAMPGR